MSDPRGGMPQEAGTPYPPYAYGQPAVYGPPGYGPPGYPQPPSGPPPLPAGVSYASWGRRAVALLVDTVMLMVCVAPAITVTAVSASQAAPGEGPPVPVGIALVVLFLGGIGLWLYNHCWTQGKRGQSWGKRVLGVHLVRETDFRPPGGGIGVARYALRSGIGNATCGLYSVVTALWPLWDARNQTIDDKILHTLVVRFPRTYGEPG